jgi:hypothetical protein
VKLLQYMTVDRVYKDTVMTKYVIHNTNKDVFVHRCVNLEYKTLRLHMWINVKNNEREIQRLLK